MTTTAATMHKRRRPRLVVVKRKDAKTYGYCRVSKEDANALRPNALRASIVAQQATINAACGSNGWPGWKPTGQYFVDIGVSGSIPFRERPEAFKLLMILQPGDHVVIAEGDRGFRSLKDNITTSDLWADKGVILHVLNCPADLQTPAGRLTSHINGAVAEYERDMIRHRTSDRMRAMQRDGRLITRRPPIGFRIVPGEGLTNRGQPQRRIEIDPDEWAIMEKIHTLYVDGWGYQAITVKLNCGGHHRPTRPGFGNRPSTGLWKRVTVSKWHQSYVKILKSKGTET